MRTDIGECWEWTGHKMSSGYGQVNFNKKGWLTHRLFWTIFNGEIPNGLWVLHHCDNPSCVRPSHLFLGTNSDNQQDSVNKGRNNNKKKTHCAKGHFYDKKNTLKLKGGRRDCRICNLERGKIWRQNNREKVRETERKRYQKNKIKIK
jgi:hypothetical protein